MSVSRMTHRRWNNSWFGAPNHEQFHFRCYILWQTIFFNELLKQTKCTDIETLGKCGTFLIIEDELCTFDASVPEPFHFSHLAEEIAFVGGVDYHVRIPLVIVETNRSKTCSMKLEVRELIQLGRLVVEFWLSCLTCLKVEMLVPFARSSLLLVGCRSPATNRSLVLHTSWSSVIGHHRSHGPTTNAG